MAQLNDLGIKPGDIILHDCRVQSAPPYVADAQQPHTLRLVQWNIERGYQLDAIIRELGALHADVIALQELDIGCERSGFKDTGRAIAEALQMHYCFVCEFEELHSPLRDATTQGGGFHGNALLTCHQLVDSWAVEHSCHPVDWEDVTSHPAVKREPRRGRRLTLGAKVVTPAGQLVVYSAHLEVFCGILSRMHQFSDILRDARRHEAPWHCQAILGDLNTMANGIARLSSLVRTADYVYCTDQLRWATLGQFEAEVWDQQVLAVQELQDAQEPAQYNAFLRYHGLPLQVCRDILNPGFRDPFHARRDITLDNPKYRIPWLGLHLMTGKLDWMLLRNMTVASYCMGNHDYSASDHKWLQADVQLSR